MKVLKILVCFLFLLALLISPTQAYPPAQTDPTSQPAPTDPCDHGTVRYTPVPIHKRRSSVLRPTPIYSQPVYGFGYYDNFSYHGTRGPYESYFYGPEYYVIPNRGVRSPAIIYAPPVVHAMPAPGVLQRQEEPLEPTIIYNNGPISAYNEYPRTMIITGAASR